jgi:hypothetical protein
LDVYFPQGGAHGLSPCCPQLSLLRAAVNQLQHRLRIVSIRCVAKGQQCRLSTACTASQSTHSSAQATANHRGIPSCTHCKDTTHKMPSSSCRNSTAHRTRQSCTVPPQITPVHQTAHHPRSKDCIPTLQASKCQTADTAQQAAARQQGSLAATARCKFTHQQAHSHHKLSHTRNIKRLQTLADAQAEALALAGGGCRH